MLTKMSPYQQQFKEKKVGFGSIKDKRFIRFEEREESRKNQRAMAFNENRNIRMSVTNRSENKKIESTPVDNDCLTRLMKWKAERQKRRRLEQTKKKPPFIVGVVRHKVYSPIKSQTVTINTTYEKVHNQIIPISPTTNLPKRITDATRKRLMNKVLARRLIEHSTKVSKPINNERKNQKQQEQSFAPKDHKFKAPTGLPHMSIRGKVAIPNVSSTKTRESNATEFIRKKIGNISAIEKQGNVDDPKECFIEPVSLKLSPDETFTCSNENNNDSNDKVKIQDSSVTESVSLTKNMSTSTPNNSPNEPVFFSPYVVSSRGKSNARKEQQLKRGFSLNRSQSNDIPTKETVMKTLNISVEEEERTAQYFRFLLNKEINRLNESCKKWTDIKEDVTTTPDGQHEINQVIGQTNLLINKKFERFRRLVTDCEAGKGEMLVTCKDLQGFWDMMYVEVKDCDTKFEQLEKLRLQDWMKEQSSEPMNVSANDKKVIAKKKTVSTKSSSIRGHLGVKSKNITQVKSSSNIKKSETINNRYVNKTYESNKNDLSVKGKTRLNLPQKEQVNETSKNMTNSLTTTKVSPMYKTPNVQLNNTISYINSDQTPRKSILKQSKNPVKVNYFVKPTSKVNFDDRVVLNEVPVDEDQLKEELGAALARIDSFDFDDPDEEEEEIHTEMKLTFDDDNFEESENDIKQNSESKDPMDAKLIKKQLDRNTDTPLSEKKLRRQNAVDETDKELDKPLILTVLLTRLEEMIEDADLNKYKQKLYKYVSIDNKEKTSPYNGSLRILRNRIISSVEPPKRRKRSKKSINIQESEYKENKTPLMEIRRKSYPVENKERKNLRNSLTKMSSNENNNKRKSRRSVKFSEKECSGCVSSKPTLPMTPHIRRSKTKSNEKRKSIKTQNLKPWTTPKRPPDRVRRSHSRKVKSLTSVKSFKL